MTATRTVETSRIVDLVTAGTTRHQADQGSRSTAARPNRSVAQATSALATRPVWTGNSTDRLSPDLAKVYDTTCEVDVARFLSRRPDVQSELLDAAAVLRRYAGPTGRIMLETEVLPGDAIARKLWIRIETQLSVSEADTAWQLLMEEWGEAAYVRTDLALIPDVIPG